MNLCNEYRRWRKGVGILALGGALFVAPSSGGAVAAKASATHTTTLSVSQINQLSSGITVDVRWTDAHPSWGTFVALMCVEGSSGLLCDTDPMHYATAPSSANGSVQLQMYQHISTVNGVSDCSLVPCSIIGTWDPFIASDKRVTPNRSSLGKLPVSFQGTYGTNSTPVSASTQVLTQVDTNTPSNSDNDALAGGASRHGENSAAANAASGVPKGSLAVTGSEVLRLVVSGLAALVFGMGLWVLGRRRYERIASSQS